MPKSNTPTKDILNVIRLRLPGAIYGCSYTKQHSEEMQNKTDSKREDIFTAGYEAGYKACLDEQTSKQLLRIN